jgi:hypothetical protein
MSRKIAILAAAAAAALAPASARADFNAGTETVASGPVSAVLSWDAGEGPSNAKLAISRNGAVVFDHPIPRVCGPECTRYASDGDAFQLVDLDGGGEPEVVLTADNGDRCCTTMGIYDFRPATGTYGELVHEWGEADFDLKDVDGDGRSELVTTDERFENLVPGQTSIFFPPIVYGYERTEAGSRLVDRTRDTLGFVRAEAAELRRLFRSLDKPDAYTRMYVGSYVAEEFLLGRGPVGLKEFDRQAKRGILGRPKSAKALRKRLLTLLDRYGYR